VTASSTTAFVATSPIDSTSTSQSCTWARCNSRSLSPSAEHALVGVPALGRLVFCAERTTSVIQSASTRATSCVEPVVTTGRPER
jgi:hypothetical protein